jgi:hypothetical protein
MSATKWLFLPLLVSVAPAWGQDQQTIDNALGGYFKAYAFCLKAHATQLARSTERDEEVVNRAFEACKDERKHLLDASQQPPVSYSRDKADSEIDKADTGIRPMVLDTVKDAR